MGHNVLSTINLRVKTICHACKYSMITYLKNIISNDILMSVEENNVRSIRFDELKDEDLRIRASAVLALGKSGDFNAVRPLSDILNNSNEVEWLRGCAAIALGRLRVPEALQPLVAALDVESPVICRSAVIALGDMGDSQAVPHLNNVLRNQSKEKLHATAATALGKIGGDEAVIVLLVAMQSSNSYVQCSAALAVGDMKIKESFSPFTELLKNENENLRAIAASSLGLIGDERAVDFLIASLNDRAATVRAIAASSLGYLGDKRAIAPLEKTLEDESLNVRKQATAALSKLNK